MPLPTQRYIGVDIKDTSIQLVEACSYKKQYYFQYHSVSSIENLSSIPLFKTNNVILSIPDEQVLTKKVCIGTTLSHKEKREYLAFEMEKLALCSREALCFDYKVVKILANNQQEVLCATVRREVIDAYIKLFENTALKVKKILMNADIVPLQIENISEGYEKACAIAISGFNKHAFNFLSENVKKDDVSHYLKLGVGLIVVLIGIFFFLYEDKKPVLVQKNSLPIAHKIRPVQRPMPAYGESLKDAPLKKIKLLGRLEVKGEAVWGIIQTPDGKISPIQKGNVIGFEQAHVSEILSNQIILIKNGKRYQIE